MSAMLSWLRLWNRRQISPRFQETRSENERISQPKMKKLDKLARAEVSKVLAHCVEAELAALSDQNGPESAGSANK